MMESNGFFDVIIVGAGPAGLAAAEELLPHELTILMIDALPRAGGQFLRPAAPHKHNKNAAVGKLYRPASALLKRINGAANIEHWHSSTVVGIESGESESYTLQVLSHFSSTSKNTVNNGLISVSCAQLIVATGCFERPINFPSWTAPGVMGAGGLQTLLKSHLRSPVKDVVLAGSHPLNLIIADQLLSHGVTVKAIVFPQSLSELFKVLKTPGIFFHGWLESLSLLRIIARLVRRRVSIHFSQMPIEAHAKNGHLEAVTIASLNRDKRLEYDKRYKVNTSTLAICYGFQVASELCRQAGASIYWSADNGGWLISTDELMRSSLKNLYAAGEQTGQHGAAAAMIKGRLAGLGALIDSGRAEYADLQPLLAKLHKQLKKKQRFAEILNGLTALPESLINALADNDTLVCRCESVTAGEIRNAIDQHNTTNPDSNAIKLITRTGMGTCQGRMCYRNLVNLINCGKVDRGKQVGPPEPFTVQFPVSPVPMSCLVKNTAKL